MRQLSLAVKIAAPALLIASLFSVPPAKADGPHIVYTVVYQCGSEVKTFNYAAGNANPYGTAPYETSWYWERTRADRGRGCEVLQAARSNVNLSTDTRVSVAALPER